MVRIALVARDGLDVALGELNVIGLTRLIHLVCDLVGLYHLDGDGVKAGALFIPICRVWNQGLFIALYIRGHQVSAVVPHGGVVHALYALYAEFIDHALRHWVHADISCYCVEIWLRSGAVINQGVIIWSIDLDHLTELRSFASVERICLFFAQGLCIFIVFFCSLDHLAWHRDVCRVVLMEVEDPLHTGQEILSSTFRFLFAVDVYPSDIIAQMEGPSLAAVLAAPIGGDARNWLAVGIDLYQTVHHVGQVLDVPLRLRIQ